MQPFSLKTTKNAALSNLDIFILKVRAGKKKTNKTPLPKQKNPQPTNKTQPLENPPETLPKTKQADPKLNLSASKLPLPL